MCSARVQGDPSGENDCSSGNQYGINSTAHSLDVYFVHESERKCGSAVVLCSLDVEFPEASTARWLWFLHYGAHVF